MAQRDGQSSDANELGIPTYAISGGAGESICATDQHGNLAVALSATCATGPGCTRLGQKADYIRCVLRTCLRCLRLTCAAH